MTEVTRNVILDLLPLYIGGEASKDTAALVEGYLKTDVELAELAHRMAQTHAHREIPTPRSKEAEMSGFEKYKQMLVIRSTLIVSLVAMFLCTAMLVVPMIIWFLQK